MALTYQEKQQLLDSLRRKAHREVQAVLSRMRSDNLVMWLDNYLRSHGYRRNFVFDCAAIPGKYGYKLFNGEKRFTSRNQLLRVCLAMHMSLEDLDHTLKLAGMNPLDAEDARDTLIIVGVENGCTQGTINEWLVGQPNMEGLYDDSP